jgi:hypothetical protein
MDCLTNRQAEERASKRERQSQGERSRNKTERVVEKDACIKSEAE